MSRRKVKVRSVELSESQSQQLRALQETSRWLHALPPGRLQKYLGRWIAAKGRRIVASALTYDGLAAQLRRQKISSVVVQMLDEPTTVIYRCNS